MESRRPAGVPKRSVLGRTPRMIWLSIWGHATSPPEDMTDLGAMQDLSPALLMRQSRWHGRFLDLHNEVAYQRWHGTHWKSRLQFALFVSGFASLVSFFTGTTATSVALKADMMRAYPDKAWLLYLSRTTASAVPLSVSIALFSKPFSRVIVFRRLYQFLAVLAFGVGLSIEALPTIWLANWGTEQTNDEPNPRNTDADAEPDSEGAAGSATTRTRGAYWHATNLDFYAAVAGGVLGLRPEFAVALVLWLIALQHAQLEAVWSNAMARLGGELC